MNKVVLGLGVLMVLGLVLFWGLPDKHTSLRGIVDIIPITTTPTVTTSLVFQGVATTTQIAAPNTAAFTRKIISQTCTEPIYVWFSTSTTGFTPSSSQAIGVSTTLTLSGETLWQGRIYAMKVATGSCSISVVDL